MKLSNLRNYISLKTCNYFAAAMLIASLLFNVYLGQKSEEVVTDTIIKTDTILVHDTISINTPVYITHTITKYDTVQVPITSQDTMHLANQFADHRTNGVPHNYLLSYVDSIPVVVPITERVYKDRHYKAVISGYDPKLVSLDIYSERSVVHNTTVVRKKPKIAISAGVYTGFGAKGFDYGLGVMLGIPVWSW